MDFPRLAGRQAAVALFGKPRRAARRKGRYEPPAIPIDDDHARPLVTIDANDTVIASPAAVAPAPILYDTHPVVTTASALDDHVRSSAPRLLASAAITTVVAAASRLMAAAAAFAATAAALLGGLAATPTAAFSLALVLGKRRLSDQQHRRAGEKHQLAHLETSVMARFPLTSMK